MQFYGANNNRLAPDDPFFCQALSFSGRGAGFSGSDFPGDRWRRAWLPSAIDREWGLQAIEPPKIADGCVFVGRVLEFDHHQR